MTSQALASAALLVALCATAQAGQTGPTPQGDVTADTPSSLRAVRDKETGRLRAPTPEEAKALAEAERAERKAQGQGVDKPVVVRQHPGGMKSAVLTPEYLSTLKAQRQPDGTLKITHADPAHEHAGRAAQQHPTE